jgi:hypothetical protein
MLVLDDASTFGPGLQAFDAPNVVNILFYTTSILFYLWSANSKILLNKNK